jgi:long-chain acyl-CoA synthetase
VESSTVAPAEYSTGSTTIADMMGIATEKFPERTAVQVQRDGAWQEQTYAEVGPIVSEVARGLIDLGLAPGDRVAILCTTRPEWAFASFGITSAGGVVVPIYPTNSPSECEWVAGNSESRFIVCEDAEQVAKILEVRDRLPALEAIVVIDPSGEVGDAIPLEDVRERGRGRTPPRSPSAHAPSAPRIPTRSSTPRAPPGRPRAACSRTATTATC